MASQTRRLESNIAGDFYVDDTCIDCGACRWVAPASFNAADGYSRVYAQPTDAAEQLRAQMALLACPTGSIGTVDKHDLTAARASFPERLTDNVYYCGYHHEDSFGAASYFLQHPEGNWLIDSPRFTQGLVKQLEALGGVQFMFLTHQDDVADHEKWHAQFNCERIIHERDARGSLRGVEHLLEGSDPIPWSDAITLIPVPGHTAGSVCLHYNDDVLFTGDHLMWSPTRGHLYAPSSACWYDWDEQIKSMQRLTTYRFEWMLPGHGWPKHQDAAAMSADLATCIAWMRRQ